MTGQLIYPGADAHTQWVGKGSVTMPMDHPKWLQHTTETAGGWPSYTYAGVPMGSAPTLTYEPWQHKWRQHFEINQSSRALENDGSFYTNRADVVQTEISCYCDEALARSVGRMDRFVGNLDAQAIDDLGNFGAWMVTEWGMKVDTYPATLDWPAYPHGVTRMTTTAYAGFSGVLGHMAAPGNSHLDPGSLNNVAIMARIKAQIGGPPAPPKVPFPALLPAQYDTGAAAQVLAPWVADHPNMPAPKAALEHLHAAHAILTVVNKPA